MLVLLFQSLRQGMEVDTPGDVSYDSLEQKQLTHLVRVFWGETECFESSPKVQGEKLKVQTVPPCAGAVPPDLTREPMTSQELICCSLLKDRGGVRKRGEGVPIPATNYLFASTVSSRSLDRLCKGRKCSERTCTENGYPHPSSEAAGYQASVLQN